MRARHGEYHAAWTYFADIIQANGGEVPPEPGPATPIGNPLDNERIWVPLWTALAASYGAGEWGAKYAAEQAWSKFVMDPITEDSAATIDAFIRGLVRS